MELLPLSLINQEVLDDEALAYCQIDYRDAGVVSNGSREICAMSFTYHEDSPWWFLTIPCRFDTQVTLEFLGLSKDAAKKVYQSWLHAQQSKSSPWEGRPIVDMAVNYVKLRRSRHNAYRNPEIDAELGSDLQLWIRALRGLGCDSRLSCALEETARQKDWLCGAASAAGWFIERIQERWEWLLSLDGVIKERKTRRQSDEEVFPLFSFRDHSGGTG